MAIVFGPIIGPHVPSEIWIPHCLKSWEDVQKLITDIVPTTGSKEIIFLAVIPQEFVYKFYNVIMIQPM